MAFVIAIGMKATGERQVLGFHLGTSEDGSFWLTFLRSLVVRGLKGVKLAISDAHEGLRAAIETTLVEATWQRCKVHVMRNVLSQAPKSSQAMVSSIVHTIFAQPTQEAAKEQLALEPDFNLFAELAYRDRAATVLPRHSVKNPIKTYVAIHAYLALLAQELREFLWRRQGT
ncbi:transposase-like protein [Alicyclobacillus cycloheptanicus]|uniref:Mutator family transposase n=1 Tax=Alicyclobacillus cycloheptanicus TaxID=1457 RepID=A0ABT9XMC5_9BACL|nr:transposase-like protein [Alicyclobacillus cycloheptanicus]